MSLNTKTRYAVRMMIDIAQQEGQRTPVRAIAERQGISEKYCEAIISELRVAELVESTRGTHGGYVLARPADKISIGEVVRAMLEPYDGSEDPRDKAIERAFRRVQSAAWKALDSVSLEDAAKRA